MEQGHLLNVITATISLLSGVLTLRALLDAQLPHGTMTLALELLFELSLRLPASLNLGTVLALVNLIAAFNAGELSARTSTSAVNSGGVVVQTEAVTRRDVAAAGGIMAVQGGVAGDLIGLRAQVEVGCSILAAEQLTRPEIGEGLLGSAAAVALGLEERLREARLQVGGRAGGAIGIAAAGEILAGGFLAGLPAEDAVLDVFFALHGIDTSNVGFRILIEVGVPTATPSMKVS